MALCRASGESRPFLRWPVESSPSPGRPFSFAGRTCREPARPSTARSSPALCSGRCSRSCATRAAAFRAARSGSRFWAAPYSPVTWGSGIRRSSASAGNATFLSNIAPLFVGLFSWMMTRQLPSRRFWIALLVSTAGSGLIVGRSAPGSGSLVRGWPRPARRRLLRSLPHHHQSPARAARCARAPRTLHHRQCSRAVHRGSRCPYADGDSRRWLPVVLIALGLICQVGGYFGLTYALGHLPATVTSILFLSVAPFTAIFAWIIFGERMGLMEIAGGALVLTGAGS